jgi:hypothetical protein
MLDDPTPELSERELEVLGLAGPFEKPTILSRLVYSRLVLWLPWRRCVKALQRL